MCFLADVIDRLNVLRGRGMASMYAWSSKRSKSLSPIAFYLKVWLNLLLIEKKLEIVSLLN